ncbi:Nn.00g048730.m01.CDS01 [Neocucurbitaria sp. VM-36]
MPSALRGYWEKQAFSCIACSEAHIGIVFGLSASMVYEKSLEYRKIHHTTIWLHGFQRHRDEIPCAWLELEFKAPNASISRIVFGTYHPDGFLRNTTIFLGDARRNLAFRELLIDLACVFLYDKPNLPAFLSTSKYFGSEHNDTLSTYVDRPTLSFETMNTMIARSPLLLQEKEEIYAVQKKVNVKSKAAPQD